SASNKQADAHPGQRRLPHSGQQHRGPSEAGDVLRAVGLGGWRLKGRLGGRGMFKALVPVFLLAVAGAFAPIPRTLMAQGNGAGRAVSRDVSKSKNFGTHFQTSDRGVACHNGITTSTGEDISIGVNWRTSMMANAGRDPYWMAGVRRETIDHPTAAAKIQDERTICHTPMMLLK